VRGFILGLSVALAFIVGVLSTNWLVPYAAAQTAGRSASAVARTPEPPVPPPPPGRRDGVDADAPKLVAPIPKWEYICYRAELTHKLVEVANQAGEEGWEMVGTDGQGTRPSIWCFKRRKNAPIEP